MTVALATREETVGPVVTSDQLDLIRRTIAKDATPDELKLYLYDCARQGVHPLDKLIHFTKRAGKYTPITSIDFMRIRAADSGEMAGSEDPGFPDEESDGKGHTWPTAATVTVYRLTQGQRFAYTATARWSEYKPEQNDFMWRKMPHTMLGKCAEALALRKGFPRQLAGLYAKEEMDQADKGGYVVEAPASVAKSDDARAGVSSAGATQVSDPSVPNGGDSGSLTITRVEAGSGALKARVIFSDGVELPVFSSPLAALCESLCQEGSSVHREIRTSSTGKDRLEGVQTVLDKTPSERHQMVTADDIAF